MALSSPGTSIVVATVLSEAGDPPYQQRIVCGPHAFLSDESRENGGQDVAPSPFGYLVAALGACTGISLRIYAEAKGWRLGAVKVALELRRHAGVYFIERSISLSAPVTSVQRAELGEVCERTPVTVAVKHGITIHTRLATPQARQP